MRAVNSTKFSRLGQIIKFQLSAPLIMNICTPPRRVQRFCTNASPVLVKTITLNQEKREWRKALFWGALNSLFLSILVYDISYMCPLYVDHYYYIECLFIVILAFNLLYYLARIVKLSVVRQEPISITLEQKKLLGIADTDPNFKVIDCSQKSPEVPTPSTPLNLSARSWLSNMSPNDSMNYSLSSSWVYSKSPFPINLSTKPSSYNLPNVDYGSMSPSVEDITDDSALKRYLKEQSEINWVSRTEAKSRQPPNLLSSFWRSPVSQPNKDTSSFLKGKQYQLATPSPVKTGSPIGKDDKSSSPNQGTAQEVWTTINIDSMALTQWNENLRLWISQTILERLVAEFDRINSSLEKHGLSDVKVGQVGIERLRKTAHMMPIVQDVPSLLALLPFLEITTNQEYLVKRIRELARGGCMSEFKWNSGGGYNGKDWDESLPTDCAVVMHLLACYLDTQLMPLPNMPDAKPFSGNHFVRTKDKMPPLTSNTMLIQEVTEKPPHYRVIIREKIYEMTKGYNNLFHSILFFLYHVNKLEHGMLGRMNLGRAGLNILWVIDG